MEYIEKTDYLKESKEILKDALIDLGANIDSNTPFRKYIDSIDDIYNDFPKATEKGSNITLENAKKGKMQIMPIGNTTQDTFTGKNLFNKYGDFNYPDNSSYTNATTLLEDGTIKTNANAAANISRGVRLLLKPNTTYVVSGKLISSTGINDNLAYIQVRGYTTWWTSLQSYRISSTGYFTFTFDSSNCTGWFLSLNTVGDVGTRYEAIFDEIQIEEGSTATSYEPYTGGIASPNPDYPQPIKNVTGNNVVKIGGKNLWDEEWELGNINNDTGGLENSDTFIRTKNYIEILPNTSYYRTSTVEATRIFYYDSLYNYMSNTIVSAAGETFTTPNNAKYIKFKQYGTAYNNDICITKGTTSTEYEPYIEPIEKELNLSGKNLAQIRNNLQPFGGSVTATKIIYNDTGTRKSSLLKIEPNTQYTIYRQKSISGGTLQSKTRYFFYDTKPIIDSTLSIGGNYLPDGLSNFITVITTPATAQYLIIQWTMDNIDAGNCAIYKGSYTLETLPKYEPYYNYTLMKDDYITEDCVIHHKRKKMILDGSEDWIDYVSQTTGLYKAYSESKKINSLFTAENSKCSHFKTSSVIATMTSEFFSATKYAIYIGISTEIASNATELKKYILQQYNNGTPVIIEYELIAEETEIIPDTIQLYNQIKELYKTIIPNQTILVETESEEENAPLIVKASALKQ